MTHDEEHDDDTQTDQAPASHLPLVLGGSDEQPQCGDGTQAGDDAQATPTRGQFVPGGIPMGSSETFTDEGMNNDG